MAENPAYRTPAEKVIYQAWKDHDGAMAAGIVGRSKIKAIADALREAGFLEEGA